MNETKTVLGRMAFYYLLLAINIIPCGNVIPDIFPTRNVSTVYLLILSVCLVFYYSHRVTPVFRLSAVMKSLSWMALLMILLRGIKYSVFAEVDILARHTWYFYYVPILLIPLFLFDISLLISPKKSTHILKIWYPILALTLLFIVLVLTNDFHQLIFKFRPNFINWNNDYSHGGWFYAITAWQYALYLASIIILVIKCRISSSKKNSWLILIPFLVGIAMNVLLITEKMPKLGGAYIIEFPEALIFMVAIVLECCMQLGLIPTNTDYGKLFQKFSIAAQITDKSGTPVYVSNGAIPLTKEQFLMPSGSRIGEHTVLYKMEIPSGFGFWQSDIAQIDRLNKELSDTKEKLAQEAELTRLKNELKERQTKLEQRTLVYDTIAKRTQKQSLLISELAKTAKLSEDTAKREECRRYIILLGTYIKRYANLMLLSEEQEVIEMGELGLSVSEILHYLNFCGVWGECIQNATGTVKADAALLVFEAFVTLLEENYSHLQGVFVNLLSKENPMLKMTFENLTKPLSKNMEKQLYSIGVKTEIKHEDGVTYISFTLPRGGDVV